MEKERKEVRIEDAMAEKEALDKKAQEILEEKDADSRLRVYKGPLGPSLCLDRIPALLHDDRCHQRSESSRDPHDFPARLYIPSLPDVQVGDEETEDSADMGYRIHPGLGRFLRLPDLEFHAHCPDGRAHQ